MNMNIYDIDFGDIASHEEVRLVSTSGEAMSVKEFVRRLVETTLEKGDRSSPRYPGNWPLDAEYAVEYTYHDRQFPSVEQTTHVAFFESLDAYHAWCDDKKEFVIGTDHDFSVSVLWYRWDLGPEFLTAYVI